MGKALKPLVIVLLLLSLTTLILGILLFGKREILKGRTQRHELAVKKIADNLRYPGLNMAQLKVYEQMQIPLDLVAVAADNMYQTLEQTKEDLAQTRQELAETKDVLAQTRAELEVAQNQIVELNATIAQKDAQIAQANSRIDSLEQEKEGLQAQIDDLNTELAKKDDQINDLEAQVVTLDNIIKAIDEPTRPQKLIGLTGRVLVVNPEWNFVVLDIGRSEGLVTSTELHVHRADQLVGKVRVNTVEENSAVADIVSDWVQTPLKEGDNVLIF